MSGQPFKLVDLPSDSASPIQAPVSSGPGFFDWLTGRGMIDRAEDVANSALVIGMGASMIRDLFWPQKGFFEQLSDAAFSAEEVRAQVYWTFAFLLLGAPFGVVGLFGLAWAAYYNNTMLFCGIAMSGAAACITGGVLVEMLVKPVKEKAARDRDRKAYDDAQKAEDDAERARIEAEMASLNARLKRLR